MPLALRQAARLLVTAQTNVALRSQWVASRAAGA